MRPPPPHRARITLGGRGAGAGGHGPGPAVGGGRRTPVGSGGPTAQASGGHRSEAADRRARVGMRAGGCWSGPPERIGLAGRWRVGGHGAPRRARLSSGKQGSGPAVRLTPDDATDTRQPPVAPAKADRGPANTAGIRQEWPTPGRSATPGAADRARQRGPRPAGTSRTRGEDRPRWAWVGPGSRGSNPIDAGRARQARPRHRKHSHHPTDPRRTRATRTGPGRRGRRRRTPADADPVRRTRPAPGGHGRHQRLRPAVGTRRARPASANAAGTRRTRGTPR